MTQCLKALFSISHSFFSTSHHICHSCALQCVFQWGSERTQWILQAQIDCCIITGRPIKAQRKGRSRRNSHQSVTARSAISEETWQMTSEDTWLQAELWLAASRVTQDPCGMKHEPVNKSDQYNSHKTNTTTLN